MHPFFLCIQGLLHGFLPGIHSARPEIRTLCCAVTLYRVEPVRQQLLLCLSPCVDQVFTRCALTHYTPSFLSFRLRACTLPVEILFHFPLIICNTKRTERENIWTGNWQIRYS